MDEMADDISSEDEDGATLLIPFQNENLSAYMESTNPDGTINRKVHTLTTMSLPEHDMTAADKTRLLRVSRT